MSAQRESSASEAQRVIASTAYALRLKLQNCRRYVSPSLNDYAGARRGKLTADAMTMLVDAALDSGGTVQDVGAHFAEMGQHIAEAQLRNRAG